MRRARTAMLILVAAFALNACGLAPASRSWQGSVNAMSSRQHSLKIPDHLRKTDAAKNGTEFDVNEFFSILKHLSMEPGYVLDYVYRYDVMGGAPVLYARPVDQPPFRTFAEFTGATGPITSESTRQYLAHVRTDGTKDGLFQLVVLYIMGDQFYLWWHANYNDTQIICDRQRLEAILLAPDDFGKRLPLDVQIKARSIALEPKVEFKDNSVVVQIVTFTKWGGFMRRSFTFSQSLPHQMLKEDREALVGYNCGVMF